MNQEKNRIIKLEYVDALRGLAILGVVLVHTNQYGRPSLTPVLNEVAAAGSRGVQLFFLISAFTLFLSLNNSVRKESNPIRNFFIRRFFRIAPMYIIANFYYLFQYDITIGPHFNEGQATLMNLIANITLLHGFNPYWASVIVPGGWTIGVEMIFYIIIPFLFMKIKKIEHAFGFFLISLLFKILFEFTIRKVTNIELDPLSQRYLFYYFPSQLPVFALGILMYFFIRDAHQTSVSGWMLLSLSVMVLIQLTIGFSFISSHILFGIAFLLLSVGLSKLPIKLIVNPIIIYLGRISFSMYLVHFAVLYWLTQINFIDFFSNGYANYSVRFLFVLSITILISSFFYQFIETTFQKVGKKLISNLEGNRKPDFIAVK